MPSTNIVWPSGVIPPDILPITEIYKNITIKIITAAISHIYR